MDILTNLSDKINKKTFVQPILYIWQNDISLKLEIEKITWSLCENFEVPSHYIYTLKDDWESIKIDQIKAFLNPANIRPSYAFQIFIIENISRLTLQSANACLKFLEEPWVWNIVFLTNIWESNILETILSRVVQVNVSGTASTKNTDFYTDLIKNFMMYKDTALLNYFFASKNLEKNDYIDFLQAFLKFCIWNTAYLYLLEEINSSLNNITNNNALAKYEIDKILLKIINHEKK